MTTAATAEEETSASSQPSVQQQQEPVLKIVVVGHEKTGKTSFVKQLIGATSNISRSDDDNNNNNNHDPFVGVGVHDWFCSVPSTSTSTKTSTSYGNNSYNPQHDQEDIKQQQQQQSLHMKVWDMTGKQNFHAVQELLFAPSPSTTVLSSCSSGTGYTDNSFSGSNNDHPDTLLPDNCGNGTNDTTSSSSGTVFVVVWDLATRDVPAVTMSSSSSSSSPPSVTTVTATTLGDSSTNRNDFLEGISDHSYNNYNNLQQQITSMPPPIPSPQRYYGGNVGGGGCCSGKILQCNQQQPPSKKTVSGSSMCSSAFRLGYDSDSDSDGYDCEMEMLNEDEIRKNRHAMEQHIDQRVQFWIDRIQNRVPGATIIPVMTDSSSSSNPITADTTSGGKDNNQNTMKETKKRCKALKDRLVFHEERTIRDLERRLRDASSTSSESKVPVGEADTFRLIKLLSRRPKIVFGGDACHCDVGIVGGSASDNYNHPVETQAMASDTMPFKVDIVGSSHGKVRAKDEEGIDKVRQYLLSSAQNHANLVVATSKHQTRDDRHLMRMLRYMLKTARRNNQPTISTEYLADHLGVLSTDHSFHRALCKLSQSGEICYFGLPTGASGNDLEDGPSSIGRIVILNPTWLVRSVDAILKYASGSKSQNDSNDNGNSVLRRTTSLGEHITNCPYIEKSEITKVWASLTGTLSPRTNAEVEFLEALLIENDILVPFTLGRNVEEQYYFVPSLVSTRKFGVQSNPNFSAALCHGVEFMDAITPSFIQRILVRLMKSLCSNQVGNLTQKKSQSSSGSQHEKNVTRVFVKEFSCWKDSYQIKLGMILTCDDAVTEELAMEIQGQLFKSIDFCSGSGCRSMLVTSIEGCDSVETCEKWKPITNVLRRALSEAVEEMPGLDYKDVAVCPYCLTKNADSVDDVATWTYSKVKMVVDDGEEVIRCRYGHSVDTRHVNGLIRCDFDKPVPAMAAVSSPTGQVEAGEAIIRPTSAADRTESQTPMLPPPKSLPTKPADGVPRSVSLPTKSNDDESSLEDLQTMRLVRERVQECEAKTAKRRFFSKKSHLALDNLGLTEKQVPTQALDEGQLGVQLQSLSLANNKLSSVPSKLVVCLPQLRALDLSNCLLFKLPTRWNLPQLKILNLSCNMLRKFPDEQMLVGLLQLEDLNMSNNRLKSVRIPSNPQVLGKLKNLDLSMNSISTSPSNLGRLKNLRVVDLNHNAITEMPADLAGGFAPVLKSASRSTQDQTRNRSRTPTKGSSRRRGLPGDPRVVMSEGPDDGARDSSKGPRPSRRWSTSFKAPLSRATQTTVSYDDNSDHHG